MADEPTNAQDQQPVTAKRPKMEMPQELESRFLRVGDKLYRSAHDRNPIATVTPDRIKAGDSSALPDLVRLAKANGWTSIKINGDADFKRAAYLAAAAQGLEIEGYKPEAKTRAAAARDIARQAGTVVIRPQVVDERKQPDQRLDLAERFRRQSHAENAKVPRFGARRAMLTMLWSSRPADFREMRIGKGRLSTGARKRWPTGSNVGSGSPACRFDSSRMIAFAPSSKARFCSAIVRAVGDVSK